MSCRTSAAARIFCSVLPHVMSQSGTHSLDQTPVQTDEQLEQSKLLSRTVAPRVDNVPGFELDRRLGEGAYGEVWLARELKTGKHVAIKFYSHRRGLDWSLLNREVEKLALLYTSRNIVRLLDVGWQHDPPYYVMEYLEGGSLETRLADGPLDPDEAVRIIRAVCLALVHAHDRGVLHCDLKPANVLLDPDSEPRLCDFGQSRLSHEQNPALGTLFYMAPEQASLKAIPDASWDVYALGALLYHLLVGQPPFRSAVAGSRLQQAQTLEEQLDTYRDIVTQGPRPRDHWRVRGVDRRLAEIVDRCLRIEPERRYSNAQQVLDVLFLRDKQKRIWPLVAMGGVGPGVILFAMFFIASNAMDSAVHTTEENLTHRALESDVLSVALLAKSVEREVQDRMTELEQVASDPHLIQILESSRDRNWSDRAELLWSPLDRIRDDVDDRRARVERVLDTSWFFVDADGIQQWRSPLDPTVIDKDWSHRDYFHGLEREFERGKTPHYVRPIEEPHISLSFVSQSTFYNMIALSVPVRGRDGSVIGVLARTMHLNELLGPQKVIISGGDGVDRTIALADVRNWRLLDHSRLTPEDNHFSQDQQSTGPSAGTTSDDSLLRRMKNAAERLVIPQNVIDEFDDANGEPVRVTDYNDPFSLIDPEGSSGEWLAALAPVNGTHWTAIVQERKSDVLIPVYQLRSRLVRYAWFAFAVAGAVVASMWYFVLKSVSGRGLRQWSRNASPDGGENLSTQ